MPKKEKEKVPKGEVLPNLYRDTPQLEEKKPRKKKEKPKMTIEVVPVVMTFD